MGKSKVCNLLCTLQIIKHNRIKGESNLRLNPGIRVSLDLKLLSRIVAETLVSFLHVSAADQPLEVDAKQSVAPDGGANPPAGEGRGGYHWMRINEIRHWRIQIQDRRALRDFGRTERRSVAAAAEEGLRAAEQARHCHGEELAEGGMVVESGRGGHVEMS